MTAEEVRAVEYRRQMIVRERNDLAAERALRGDPAAFRVLLDNWAPLILAVSESR